MKIAVFVLGLFLTLWGKEVIVYENQFTMFPAGNPLSQVIVGNKDLLSVTVMDVEGTANQNLRLFGKKSGSTSLLLHFRDGSVQNYSVYINQDLGFIQSMVRTVAPHITLDRAGDGATMLKGTFDNPHQKKRVIELLSNAGIDANRTMDLSDTRKIEKMVRTKLYLVSIDNDRAEELGGAVGLNYFAKDGKVSVNAGTTTYATFSGFLLDQTGKFASTGKALLANLNFLQSKGVAKIMDDTVLITTEDKNASFHVGGEVYIPIGMTYNNTTFPTISLDEKEYGLRLTMKPKFLEKESYMGINIVITDSEFDEDPAHRVQLGANVFVPAFRAKNISTDIVARNAQVIALGGRLHSEKIKREEKVPLLGDIPVLGHLFKRTTDSTRANDLLFFLVPEIVDSNEALNETDYFEQVKQESVPFHELPTSTVIPTAAAVSKPAPIAEKLPQKALSVLKISEDIPAAQIAPSTSPQPSDPSASSSQLPVESLSNTRTRTVLSVPQRKRFSVAIPNIYIRNAPQDGEPISVWEQGHTFVANEEKTLNGTVWIRIVQDCREECISVNEPMWVSKKYLDEV